MESGHLIVITTCPDRETAESLAGALIDAGLAACINLVPGVTSIYEWKGSRQTGSELILLIKTRASLYGQVERKIAETHPYELPEVLAVSVKNGLADYLAWMDESTRTQQ